jgi:hypothetical protein
VLAVVSCGGPDRPSVPAAGDYRAAISLRSCYAKPFDAAQAPKTRTVPCSDAKARFQIGAAPSGSAACPQQGVTMTAPSKPPVVFCLVPLR